MKISELLTENEQERIWVVIGNAGVRGQNLWPETDKPKLYTKDEADAIVAKANTGNSLFHFHTKMLTDPKLFTKYVNSGKAMSAIRDLLHDYEQKNGQ